MGKYMANTKIAWSRAEIINGVHYNYNKKRIKFIFNLDNWALEVD